MNLDDTERFAALDSQGMLKEIENLPDQLAAATELGKRLPLPEWEGIRQVVVAGMGGSAIGGDLAAAYAASIAMQPVTVWRNYELPAFARGPETLVVAASHSGNTEETLSAFERGRAAGVRMVAVTTGGELARRAREAGVPVWRFEHAGQPRAAIGYSFGLLMAVLGRLAILADPGEDVRDAVAVMKRQQRSLTGISPVGQNPAKRLAGQLVGRWPTVIGSGLLAPVARRWRTQMAELSKAVAQFEELPEADHNLVAGVENPEALFGQTMVVFLRASQDHPRNLRRIEVTRQVLMVEGFNTDTIDAAGEKRMAQQWSCLHFGDYVAYYLAMAYEVDPTPVAAIEDLKQRMKA